MEEKQCPSTKPEIQITKDNLNININPIVEPPNLPWYTPRPVLAYKVDDEYVPYWPFRFIRPIKKDERMNIQTLDDFVTPYPRYELGYMYASLSVLRRFIKTDPIISVLYNAFFNYPAPVNLNYFWNFGFYAGFCLIVQIVTGIFLAMHYAPEATLAMASVEHIMRDVNYGWLLRYIHANGASMFFIVVYIHIFRGLYFGSYLPPRIPLWLVGVAILFLMILTAFLGYVLPWGQMSFWGATVITNLVSAVPYIGNEIVVWLWGGYSVDNATLNRFFSLHYFLPFVILSLVGLHIIYLHQHGSNNPVGVIIKFDYTPFYPYYVAKDYTGIILFCLIFAIFVFFIPNTLGHPDNYILANPLVTPTHIVPEWYFLPFYAVLRSIPDKLGGVLGMVLSILALGFLPFLAPSMVRSCYWRPLAKLFFYFFIAFSVLLGWLGSQPAEEPYVSVARTITSLYFAYYAVFMPIEVLINHFMWNNDHFVFKIRHPNIIFQNDIGSFIWIQKKRLYILYLYITFYSGWVRDNCLIGVYMFFKKLYILIVDKGYGTYFLPRIYRPYLDTFWTAVFYNPVYLPFKHNYFLPFKTKVFDPYLMPYFFSPLYQLGFLFFFLPLFPRNFTMVVLSFILATFNHLEDWELKVRGYFYERAALRAKRKFEKMVLVRELEYRRKLPHLYPDWPMYETHPLKILMKKRPDLFRVELIRQGIDQIHRDYQNRKNVFMLDELFKTSHAATKPKSNGSKHIYINLPGRLLFREHIAYLY